jgi:hypothetical protein
MKQNIEAPPLRRVVMTQCGASAACELTRRFGMTRARHELETFEQNI